MTNYKDAKGWLRADEREELVRLARDIGENESAVIVNIGVEYGASIACFRAGNSVAHVIGIDIDCSKFIDNDYSCQLIEADSFKMSIGWDTGVDLLFIDGDHSYEGVKRDTEWIKFSRKGGYVIFHDCYDFDDPSLEVHGVCPGVNQAVVEWGVKQSAFEELDPVGTMRIFRRVE